MLLCMKIMIIVLTLHTHIFAWLMLFGSINCYEIDVVVIRFVRNFGGRHAQSPVRQNPIGRTTNCRLCYSQTE